MIDYKQLSKDSFSEINLVRTNPYLFIFPLEQMAKLFSGDVLHIPGEIPLKTKEGVSAVYDCIEFLKQVKPVSSLDWSEEMARACQDLADDIGPKNIVGHIGSDGLNMSKRLEKYGEWSGSIAENIDFGSKTGKNVVLSGIIDDGDSSRGYRKNLFNPKFRSIGIGAARHGAYGTCVVINYAETYNRKGEKKSPGMNYEEMEHREAPKKSGVSYSSNPDDRYSKSEKVSKTTNQSQGKKKGEDIEEDQDKPKGTISTKITKNITIKNGKKTTIEKKIYTLQDGSTQIVENETIEEER